MQRLKIKFDENSYYIDYNTDVLKDKTDKIIKVFGYVRVSTNLQQKDSIESQITNIENTCAWKKATLVSIYIDDGISGSTLKNRPGIMKLLNVIDKLSVKHDNSLAIYTFYLNRLTRSRKDMDFLCETLSNLNVDLNCFDCSLNIKDRKMHIMYAFFAEQAQEMRMVSSENTKNVMRQLSEDGKLLKRGYGFVIKVSEDEFKMVGGKKVYTKYRMQIPREQECISKVLSIWEENGRNITTGKIAEEMNRNHWIYRENDPKWNQSRVERIIYEKKLSERVIPVKIPISDKDKVCIEAIKKLIDEGVIGAPYIISRKLNDLCLFKHKITDNYVRIILDKMGARYSDALEKNKEKYEAKLKRKLLKIKNKKWKERVEYLNEHQLFTPKGKYWSMPNLKYYCSSRKIYVKNDENDEM